MYNDEPFEFTDDPEEQKLVLGGEACMWAETVDVSDLYNTVWPRAGAFAGVLVRSMTSRLLTTDFDTSVVC